MKAKSSRKTWVLGLAALAVVLMFGALLMAETPSVAQAQEPPTPNPAVSVDNPVDDFELELTVSGSLTQIDDIPSSQQIGLVRETAILEATLDDPLFKDDVPASDPVVSDVNLAFTVVTTAPTKVVATLDANYNDMFAPDGGAVSLWWDSLTDSQKIAVLGIDKDATDDDSDTCDHPLCVNNAGQTGFTGDSIIENYAGATADIPADDVTGQVLITQAFHWNLLDAQEMYDAARPEI